MLTVGTTSARCRSAGSGEPCAAPEEASARPARTTAETARTRAEGTDPLFGRVPFMSSALVVLPWEVVYAADGWPVAECAVGASLVCSGRASVAGPGAVWCER